MPVPRIASRAGLRYLACAAVAVFIVLGTVFILPANALAENDTRPGGFLDDGSGESKYNPNDSGSGSGDKSGEGGGAGEAPSDSTSPYEQQTGKESPKTDEGTSGSGTDDGSGGKEGYEEPTDSTSPREEMTGDDGSGDSEDGGGDGNIGARIFAGILEWAFEDRLQANAEKLTDMLTVSAFTLPTPEGEIRTFYERTSGVVQPGAVVLLLLTGLMMTLRGTNYNTAYATQSALPKIVIFIAGLAFFPQIMVFISDLSSNLSNALLDENTMANALQRVQTNQIFLGFTLIGVLVNICAFVLILGLVLISLVKSFLFAVLFIAGPLAMFLYPIPALSGIASSWFKGTLACTAIPLLWCIEVWIGTAVIESPEMVFGDMPGVRLFSSITVLILTWVMIKTPFKVFEYCFYGYTSGGGITSQIGRGVATAATISVGRTALTRGGGSGK